MTSGHIQADKAIKNYLSEENTFKFPYHEVFKGTLLGQWKHYKEERSEAYNLFDSRFGTRSLQLLRILILKYLHIHSQDSKTVEVDTNSIIEIFSNIGASKNRVIESLRNLNKFSLIRENNANQIEPSSTVFLTMAGGYYCNILSRKFVYGEAILHDTAIYDNEIWESLVSLTEQIEVERNILERLELRKERISCFCDYLISVEKETLENLPSHLRDSFRQFEEIKSRVIQIVNSAIRKTKRYSNHP